MPQLDSLRFGSSCLLALAACIATMSGCRAPSNSESRHAAIELESCQLRSPGLPTRLAAQCGHLTVAENPDEPEGRTIDLFLAVVPAVSRNPRPDPFVFLPGGPGQAATETFLSISGAFRTINKERDILLVDQRGTGSSNSLRCPDPGDAWDPALLSDEEMDRWTTECLEQLDADPRFYTTSVATDDLDAVREALGYDRLNLYGGSYGTRAALSYLRRYPAHVRTLILDGVVPASEVLGVDVARDAQRALDKMVTRCNAEPECQETFPRLESELDELFAELDHPISVTLPHPTTGVEETIHFDRPMAASAIRLLSYSPESLSLLPLLVREAAEGNWKPLASQFLLVNNQVSATMSEAMGYSILCSEDFPFFEPDTLRKRNENTYLGALQTDALEQLCPRWPRGTIPPDFKEPVRSDVPILLLSGEADPVTPPENGEEVASQLKNSLHIVAPSQGHIVIHRGCIPNLAARFVEKGRLSELDTDCVEELTPAPFFTSFNGPEP